MICSSVSTTAYFTLLLVSVPLPKDAITYLDLQPKANHKLDDTFHDGFFANNNLAELPRGKRTFQGVKFNIGDKLIQLGSKRFKGKPEKVEGIKVGKRFAKLYILHATGYAVPDNTLIGKYVVHYEDKSKETIDIRFGQDVRDWWFHESDKDVSRGKVAWTGSNEPAKRLGCAIRLYLMTWNNPHPKKKVASIDCVSTMTDAAPFVVAMTIEKK